jgi:hypothetical protein
MAATRLHPFYDTLFGYLVEKATPEEILAFQHSEDQRSHITDLLDKQDEGTLTADEMAEMETLWEVELFIMALQTKARKALRKRK